MKRKSDIPNVLVVVTLAVVCLHLAWAQYGGGTGEPNDPYQIWTAEQMNAIGADPNSRNKCFVLMADLDLSAYDGKDGRPAFNAIGSWGSGTTATRGGGTGFISVRYVFDGNGHTLSNLTLNPGHGLFTSLYGDGAEIKNLTLVRPTITAATGPWTGALVGSLGSGNVTNCHVVDGVVTGTDYVGGLVGDCGYQGKITDCHVAGIVMGNDYVGGLVGDGSATQSFATATVVGRYYVGGLAGNGGATNCYATGTIMGDNYVGGLLGRSGGCVNCYATGLIAAPPSSGGSAGRGTVTSSSYTYAGGLLGYSYAGSATASFWDIETSGQGTSAYGIGKTTAQMQTVATFLDWGTGTNAGVWTIDEGNDYPRLAWEQRPGVAIGAVQFSDLAVGTGTADDPYLISTPVQLYLLTKAPAEWSKCFKLTADLNMADYAGKGLASIGTLAQPFTGCFDGNGHTISKYVHISTAGDYAGFFGYIREPTEYRHIPNGDVLITNLGLIDPTVRSGTAKFAGALVAYLSGGTISGCCAQGGLVLCGTATGGGIAGCNGGIIKDCFARTPVVGGLYAGGLVGENYGTVTNCYSTGLVEGGTHVAGLVSANSGHVTASFWDSETSGRPAIIIAICDYDAAGLTTVQMYTAGTFLDAGWDFVGETANGTADIWWIDEGKDYPKLWWQAGQ